MFTRAKEKEGKEKSEKRAINSMTFVKRMESAKDEVKQGSSMEAAAKKNDVDRKALKRHLTADEKGISSPKAGRPAAFTQKHIEQLQDENKKKDVAKNSLEEGDWPQYLQKQHDKENPNKRIKYSSETLNKYAKVIAPEIVNKPSLQNTARYTPSNCRSVKFIKNKNKL
jgi:hypothetical protein